ncbi:hypothetical protein F3Y22_tig00111330pilonHSYRG00281 [Hibiscus syriacus]|uniref:Uncharacterized protein n=1 Tax=Hibiscus syriacus TaxID=106335 RepID=A0A6A2YPV2_HIBSY|nr:hypothetical protein F3Y22_tig00111330pilonHSYRG00281 [Hibiscus syriacus]
MIAEKPSWVRDEGMHVFSIDVQPAGLRYATSGGDHKCYREIAAAIAVELRFLNPWVKRPFLALTYLVVFGFLLLEVIIVAELAFISYNDMSGGYLSLLTNRIFHSDLENDESTQRLLATLRDHFGSANCVSGEPPDIENWKVSMTLRGHTADVVDLNWSSDDSILASGSLDNTVHIWNMSNGICTALLRGHSSLVKGVAWDPIGSFIATGINVFQAAWMITLWPFHNYHPCDLRIVQASLEDEETSNDESSGAGSFEISITVEKAVQIEVENGGRCKTRGRITLKELYELPYGNHVKVSRNDVGQPIGPEVAYQKKCEEFQN